MEINKNEAYISPKEATNIAVLILNANPTSIKNIETDFNYEEEIALYNIKFEYKDSTYQYKVRATDGKILSQKKKHTFEGELTKEELLKLQDAHVSEENIEKIKAYLLQYKEYLTSFTDLVGDTGIPNEKNFYFNMEHFGHLLYNDPKLTVNKMKSHIRRYTASPLIRTFGHYFLNEKQYLENRYNLLKPNDFRIDKGITLPKEPVIWVSNHGFKMDLLSTLNLIDRHAYLMLASLPQFFNTEDGILSHANGVALSNRKVESSRQSFIPKCEAVLETGTDVYLCPEGVHNKTMNQIILELWSGAYRLAKQTGLKVIPVTHFIKDPGCKMKDNAIHTVIDDPINVTHMSKEEFLTYLRDVFATWYYLMAEKYGSMSRNELIDWYQKRAFEMGKISQDEFQKEKLTSSYAFEISLLDLASTVDRYDSTIETTADFRSKNIIRPEDAFANIANLNTPNSEIQKLVHTRKIEDFQRRF